VERFLSRMAFSVAATVVAIILVATAAFFLCAALYLFLVSLSAAPPLAAFLVGLTALIVAGLCVLAARGLGRTSGGGASKDPGNLNDLAARLGGLAAQQLGAQAQAHPYRAFVGALLAGLAVGASPELRSMLEKIFKN